MLCRVILLPHQGSEQLGREAAGLTANYSEGPVSVQNRVDAIQGPAEVEDDLVVERPGMVKDRPAAMQIAPHSGFSSLRALKSWKNLYILAQLLTSERGFVETADIEPHMSP